MVQTESRLQKSSAEAESRLQRACVEATDRALHLLEGQVRSVASLQERVLASVEHAAYRLGEARQSLEALYREGAELWSQTSERLRSDIVHAAGTFRDALARPPGSLQAVRIELDGLAEAIRENLQNADTVARALGLVAQNLNEVRTEQRQLAGELRLWRKELEESAERRALLAERLGELRAETVQAATRLLADRTGGSSSGASNGSEGARPRG